jgi:hypothetical protein
MAESIFVTSLLVVFLARDVHLLTTAGRWSLGTRLLAYAFVKLAFVAGFLLLCPQSANGVFAATLRLPLVWSASLVLHTIGWLMCLIVLRGNGGNAWTIALLPSPILLLSLICLQRASSAALTTLYWILLVSALAFTLNRKWCDDAERRFIVEFAGLSNLTVLAAIPVVLLPA